MLGLIEHSPETGYRLSDIEEATESIGKAHEDASALFTTVLTDIQAKCFYDLVLSDRYFNKDCKPNIESPRRGRTQGRPPDFNLSVHISFKDCKPKIESFRCGRAHGRPPDLSLPEHIFPDQHDTSTTYSRVLTGSEPETMNIESMRQPFVNPALCSSPALESALRSQPTTAEPASHTSVSFGWGASGGSHATPTPRA